MPEFGGLEISKARTSTVESCPEHDTRLKSVMRSSVLAPPAECIGDQTGQHRLRWEIADHAEVVDGLAAEGHKRTLEADEQVCRHLSTRHRELSVRSTHPVVKASRAQPQEQSSRPVTGTGAP